MMIGSGFDWCGFYQALPTVAIRRLNKWSIEAKQMVLGRFQEICRAFTPIQGYKLSEIGG
jgi:hypothetical protein